MNRIPIGFSALSLVLLFSSAPPSAAEAVERFPARVRVAGHELVRHGAGVLRYKRLIPVYDAALYLPENAKQWEGQPKRLDVVYRVNTEAARFTRAGDALLERNYSDKQLAPLRDRLARINAWYPDPRPGDRCVLAYTPGIGTELIFNGQSLGTIEGEDFARVYFSIWLGNQPACPRLRSALLAGRES
jgi:hypothetical protein